MRVLVTGAGGMLAHDLVPELERRGHDLAAFPRIELDVVDEVAVSRALHEVRPDAVVHCAAFTAVDGAEADEARATLVNGTAAGYLASACSRVGARLVYPSTDYVFPGTSDRPYRPEDEPLPVNAYGRSKLAGERAVMANADALVIRTSWLYGAGGRNFVDTIRRLSRERPPVDVVNDQFGRPTWTASLATAISDLIERQAKGIFHATGGGDPASWFDVATRVVGRVEAGSTIRPVPTAGFPRPARRPSYSVLDCTKTEAVIGWQFPDWKVELSEYLGAHAADDREN